MSESNPLKAIEEALAAAAKPPDGTPENVNKWLAQRKQFLDQEAQSRKLGFDQETQMSRTKFWRVMFVVCVLLVAALLAMLILRVR